MPLLLLEFLLVAKLQADTLNQKAWTLGVAAALMTVSGYYGELVVTGDLKASLGLLVRFHDLFPSVLCTN